VWLCSPKLVKRDEADFRKSLDSGNWRIGRYPDIDSENERFLLYFEAHGLNNFKLSARLDDGKLVLQPEYPHLEDLFCAYLINECNGKSPPEMPLKICRPCGKLFASDLASAEYCSAKCRGKSFWTPERKRDYNKISRWEQQAANALKQKHGFTLADLDHLKKITARDNALDEIATRWENWPKMTEKVTYIRASILKGAQSHGR
jgi:hypothetical protein